MHNRRDFIRTFCSGMALAGLNSFPIELLAANELIKITILHTNDVHSHIDPFPASDPKNPNMGGVSRRATLIENIRKEQPNVLLLLLNLIMVTPDP